MTTDKRPNPDELLAQIKEEEEVKTVGELRIFFGYAAGVGKTYAMLEQAQERLASGEDVLVGYIEPHTRPETMRQLEGLPLLPPKEIEYRSIKLREFDIDFALERQPSLILVDELAHSNAGGSRNKKRYQDIEELLKSGIDVYTTVNVQHMESLNDIIHDLLNVHVHETVPDYIFDQAESIKLIDIEPEVLLRRFKAGKIYQTVAAEKAMQNFFTLDNLRILRELALRSTTEKISYENQLDRRLNERMANTKVLVCIGPSPSSAKCIRWTARTADALNSNWVAVYVESFDSEHYTVEQQKMLQQNLDLVDQLGGENVTLTGRHVAETITEYAQLSGITNIVLGKSRKRHMLFTSSHHDIEDQLIDKLSNVEVHIIPDIDQEGAFQKKNHHFFQDKLTVSRRDFLVMSLVLIITTGISYALTRLGFGHQNIVMIFILSVLIISLFTKGYVFGFLASILSVILFDFFFVETYFSLEAVQTGYPLTFVILLVVALITSTLTTRARSQAQFVVQKEQRTGILYEISKRLLITRGTNDIATLIGNYLYNMFDRPLIIYTEDPVTDVTPFIFDGKTTRASSNELLTSDEAAVAHWVFVNQKTAGAGTNTLMGSSGSYFPVATQGEVLAVVGFSTKEEVLSHEAIQLVQMILSQFALALERQRLSDTQRQISVDVEKEKMRSNLLRAIAHDLRTPLSGILGASATLKENWDTMELVTRDSFLDDIHDESEWLIHMVENLLLVTRINDTTLTMHTTLESAEEVVGEAVRRIQKRYPIREICVQIPVDYLEVPMDGTLIVQVLINFLENAIKFSPETTPVEVKLSQVDENAVFEVRDHGSGINEEDAKLLFTGEKASSASRADATRGIGIGLSICQTIIHAHHGTIAMAQQSDGGSLFYFTLPIEQEETP